MKRSLIVVLMLAALYLAFDHQGIFAAANAQLSKSPALARVSGLLKTFVVGGGNAAAPQLDRAAAQQKGLEHLARYAQEKGYARIQDVRVRNVEIDELGMGHTRVQQMINGVPVWGGEAIVHVKSDGSLFAITDSLSKDLKVETTPSLSAEDAIERAKSLYDGSAYLTADPVSDLWIWQGQKVALLVYRVQMRREDGSAETAMPVYFIDAQTGEKVWEYDNLQTGSVTGSGVSLYSGTVSLPTYQSGATYYLEDVTRKIGTFNYNNTTISISRFTDTDNIWNSAIQNAGVDAQYGALKTYDYYLNVHGRNGIDGAGGPGSTISIDGVTNLVGNRVHYSTNYNNAFWNGSYMTYGDGDGTNYSPLVSLDIAGHEMTHGVTERTANLVYSGESGALNESMSDVFGAMVERYTYGESANTWRIGEQAYTPATAGDALRYLDNPHLASNGGFTADDDPDHYSERYTGTSDNGGVHTNSGIGNKAFYMVAKGGTHHLSGVTVTGIGADDAAKIWYKALTTYMTSSTNFAGARTATLNAATAIFGGTSAQYTAVATAWCAVGVGLCSSPPPPPTGTNLFVNGGFETSISPWIMSGAGAFYVANGNYPQAGTGYAYFGAANSVSGQTYQQITIPAGAAPNLTFYLNVTSEETTTTTQYDKLFVEVLNSSGTLLSTLATYSNLNKTATASVYSQKGPFNLAAYAGQTVRVQFRTTTDSAAITTFRLDTAAAQNSCSTITVTNPAINTGTAGTAFSQTFTQTGGSGTMTFSTTSTLPTGLTLSSTGVLSGTPTKNGSFPIVVKATDANGCSGTGATYTLTINCPTITLSSLTGGTVGTAYNQTVTAAPAGGGYTFAVTTGTLPAGLALNSATGAITGTPTTAGTSNFTITATGFGGCTKAQAYSLVICSVITVNPATLPNGTVGTVYANQTITVSPAGTYTFSVVSGALPTGLTLNASTGVISGTPTAGGTFTPTIRATGAGGCFGQRAYSISIACATVTVNPATLPGGTVGAVYANQTITASPASTYTYSIVSGALPPGLTLNANTGVISGTPTAGGTFTPTIRATGLGGCNGQRTYTITIPCTTITVSPATLPGGTVGTVYTNQTIAASPAGTYTFSVVSGALPTGLTLNTTTGVISGTPTAGGTFTPTIRATGAGGCTGQTAYTISIACATVTVNPATLPGGTVGTVYTNQTITASPASTYTYSVVSGALPTGLTLNASTGVISGTPTAGGTFTPTIRATGLGGCNGQRAYTISIACPTVTINPATLPAAKAGTAYSQQLTANIAGTYSLQTDPLPTGLTLSSAGLISGTTSQIGSFSITVKLTAGTCTGTRAYTLTVGLAALAMKTALAQIADYDGDGKSDQALWSAQSGEWRILLSGDQQAVTQTWGEAGDVSLLGDYDGDGKTDLAVYRPETGGWRVKQSSDRSELVKAWGQTGDVPMPGDYDGDGKTDIAVFRPSEGNWYVLRSSDEQREVTAWGTSYAPYYDVPVAGDYDGDGLTDLAVFRRATGTWLVKGSGGGKLISKQWGIGSDVPVAADYDGDGKTDFAVWRANTGTWYIWQSSTNDFRVTEFGTDGASINDQASPGDFDGDGQADFAIWQAATSTWLVKCSSDNRVLTQGHGQVGDVPVNARRQ